MGKNWVKEFTELCVCELVSVCVRNSSKLRKAKTETGTEKRERQRVMEAVGILEQSIFLSCFAPKDFIVCLFVTGGGRVDF